MTEYTPDVSAMSPDAAAKEITATLENPDHDYWKQGTPAHLRAVDRMTGLYEAKLGEAGEEPSELQAETGETRSPELEDEMAEVMTAPESPEEYSFDKINPPPDVEWNHELEQDARGWFHAGGLSQVEVDGINAAMNDTMRRSDEQIARTREATITTLKLRLGNDGADAFIQRADDAARHLGGDDLINWLADTGLGADFRVLTALERAYTRLGGE